MKDKITEIADALAKVIRNIKSFSDDDRDQVSKLLQDELTIAPDNITDDYKNKKWVFFDKNKIFFQILFVQKLKIVFFFEKIKIEKDKN